MPPEADTAYQKCSNCFVTLDASEMEPFSEIICPRCNATVRVRSRFNNFELTEVIAHGGMGTVYKARDLNLNRIVALKLLRREFSADQEYIRKLETEAQITAQVNHPHVVKVYSFGGDHGQFYIAMELMEKGSLDDLMVSQGRIPEMQMLEVGIQAARGLRAAFHAGLIHRDIKPGNILFADEHIAKLVDFGLALPLAQAQEAEAELWGTPYYVSPEKLNNEPEDFRSDIYCLGGTLFHAMAGRPPFPAETASVAVLKELKSNPVSLQAVAPDISSPTAYVINRTLSKNPADRYHSYDELIEHLEYARAQLAARLEHGRPSQKRKPGAVIKVEEPKSALSAINIAILLFVLFLAGGTLFFKDALFGKRTAVPAVQRENSAADGNAETNDAASGQEKALVSDHILNQARRQLLNGDMQSALTALKQFEERPNVVQPQKNWAILMEGIAAHLNNLAWDGRNTFERLRSDGPFSDKDADAKLARFFVETGRLMAGEGVLNSKIASDYTTDDFEPVALLAFGLKNWEANDFAEATAFFQAFLSTDPQGKYRWIGELKPLAQRYVDDYEAYKELGPRLEKAKSAAEKAELLPEIAKVKAQLRLAGKLAEKLNACEQAFKTPAP